MQGRSLLPVLRGRTPADWRTSMYYRYYHDPGDHNTRAHYGVRTRTHKLIHFWKKDQWELFDLVNDPYELHNLYGEPGQEALTATLKAELARLKQAVRDDDQLADEQLPNGVDGPVAKLREGRPVIHSQRPLHRRMQRAHVAELTLPLRHDLPGAAGGDFARIETPGFRRRLMRKRFLLAQTTVSPAFTVSVSGAKTSASITNGTSFRSGRSRRRRGGPIEEQAATTPVRTAAYLVPSDDCTCFACSSATKAGRTLTSSAFKSAFCADGISVSSTASSTCS